MMLHMLSELDKLCSCHEKIYIYGIGTRSSFLYRYLQSMGWEGKIASYIVTKVLVSEVNGIPVCSANGLPKMKSLPVLIATQERFQEEIRETLANLGITQSYSVSEDVFRGMQQRNVMAEEKLEQHFLATLSALQNIDSMGRDMLLITPPYWDVYAPFSAVPSLVAALDEAGIRADQLDLGIECFHTLLELYGNQVAANLLTERFYNENIAVYENNIYASYDEYFDKMWFLREPIFPFQHLKLSYDELDSIQQKILGDFFNYVLATENQGFNLNAQGNNLTANIVGRSWYTLWKTLSKDKIIKEFALIPLVVGFSATCVPQLVVACKLAKIIRRIFKEAKLVLGGSAADLFMDSLYPDKTEIFSFFDYVIVGEGETAITALYKHCMCKEGKLEDVPNLAFLNEDGHITITRQYLEDVETLPLASYRGLDLSRYAAPCTILPYQASRGCHYGHCAFCNHNEKYRHNYRPKSPAKVVREICELSTLYRVSDFQFVDEAIRPDVFKKIVSEMEESGLFHNKHWVYYSRVSLEYTKEILEKAVNCGCRMVMFGVETFNDRLLRFIRKGINAATSKSTLKLFSNAGIKTYAWMMCNLPSETVAEVKEDIEKLKQELPYIDAVGVGIFLLEINTDMYQEPDKFNIIQIDEENRSMFVSHNNGQVIDKAKMLACFENDYVPFVKRHFLSVNRYFVYFATTPPQ